MTPSWASSTAGNSREHVAALPDQLSPARSSYGLNIKSLVVYLLVYVRREAARCRVEVRCLDHRAVAAA